MKTLLFCILALAIGGVYYYWRNASELRPETPAEIPLITKAREMFPDNAEKQRNWLKEARAFAEKIEKISPPKSAEDLGAINRGRKGFTGLNLQKNTITSRRKRRR